MYSYRPKIRPTLMIDDGHPRRFCSCWLASWLAEANGWESELARKRTDAEHPAGIVFRDLRGRLPLLFEAHQLPTDSSDEALFKPLGRGLCAESINTLYAQQPPLRCSPADVVREHRPLW